MDNKKVGAFISERRKVKQLTQQELADKCIVKFKLVATLSVILSIIGLIIPYFIWKDMPF